MKKNLAVSIEIFSKIIAMASFVNSTICRIALRPDIIINLTIVVRFRELNPQAPVAQKNAVEVVFRRFQGEGVEFF